MSARMNIFANDMLRLLQKNVINKTNHLTSVCLPANQTFSWLQQGITYTVSGPNYKNQNSFANCFKSAIKTIENKIVAPVEIRDKEIYAFSFYYDRLKSAQLLKRKIYENLYNRASN